MIRLENRLMAVDILPRGATVQRLRVGDVEAVLGFDDEARYEADRSYQGCVIGRVANRIAGARFSLDGTGYRVSANEGANCLHGGALGFDKRDWEVIEADGRGAALRYVSEDGEEGFPGRVEAICRFRFDGEDGLEISYEARADRPTPVALTHHLYFNLAGSGTILDHVLRLASDHYTPVRPDLIPTGEIAPVAGTPFDFTRARRIGEALDDSHPQTELVGGFDHNWALRTSEMPVPALTLASPRSGLSMGLFTDQPGLQLYTSQGLGPPFGKHAGLVIEPQGFPDAINQPGFASPVLRPGETYRRRMLYCFALS